MELYCAPETYERVIHTDNEKLIQVRLVVSTFRGVEYIHLRKYFLNFDEEWCPTPDGIAFPLDLDNSRELFTGLVEILSLAESKDILEQEFKEQLDNIYLA
jgi:hypothetical protein